MTTIATDGTYIASDTQATTGNIVDRGGCCKVWKLRNGSVVGVAGDVLFIQEFLNWLEDRTQDKPTGSDNFSAIQLYGDGTMFLWDERCKFVEVLGQQALGSGAQFALGAMMAGATPKQAVQIACKLDCYSSGPIRTIKPTPSSKP